MKIVVLGASGVVGFHISETLSEKHEVVRVARRSQLADVQTDLSTEAGIAKALECRPEVVVNSVKPSAPVEMMEERKHETYALNTLLPERLAKLQPKLGFLLVHISTDGVYPGFKGELYNEGSVVYPLNYYCYTKALAEELIACIAKDYLILRPEGVFGYDERGSNFFMRMAAAEKQGKSFSAATDQFSQPICGLELARLVKILISKKKRGIYNACGPNYVSRYELASKIKAHMGWGLNLEKFTIMDRLVRVQAHLRVDISKMHRDAGKIAPLGSQIDSIGEWMRKNRR